MEQRAAFIGHPYIAMSALTIELLLKTLHAMHSENPVPQIHDLGQLFRAIPSAQRPGSFDYYVDELRKPLIGAIVKKRPEWSVWRVTSPKQTSWDELHRQMNPEEEQKPE